MCGRYELNKKFSELPEILKESMPRAFKKNYEEQKLIKPNDPVLVLKNEGKISTSFMLWGFISEWAKNPFNSERPKPFNARSESITNKKLFKDSWRYKRCVLPASGFFEKGCLIRRKDYQSFWLAGIWSKWMSKEGSELESCCILTTKPNKLLSRLHNRMPVVIPDGLERNWIEPMKNLEDLRVLEPIMNGWDSNGWTAKPINSSSNYQIPLF